MTNKAVFITGGASGIGLELVGLYAADGWQIGVGSAEPQPEDWPAAYFYRQMDVTDVVATAAAVTEFSNQAGRLDLLVANAGINHPKAAVPDFERGRKVIEINVIGVLNSFEPAIAIMKEQGFGQLAALGSIAGLMGTSGTSIYGASKAAVLNLCEAMAIDLAEYGIAVTGIAPGFIATPLTANNDHAMPFEMTAPDAARQIKAAIDSRAGFVILPWQMRWIAGLLRRLPRSWYRAFMRRDPLKMHH